MVNIDKYEMNILNALHNDFIVASDIKKVKLIKE